MFGAPLNARVRARYSMHVVVTAKHALHVGTPIVVEGTSPDSPLVGVFEDDGSTGYFYSVDTRRADQPILEALHIYDVSSVADRAKESSVEIGWSSDGLKAALLINGLTHAIYDFISSKGYGRQGHGSELDRLATGLFP